MKRPSPRQPPDAANLREAALGHLARYATTERGLIRVLHRRIDRWAREAQGTAEPDAIAQVVAATRADAIRITKTLAEAGAVSDADFAQSRARSLARAGRSRRAITAHLRLRGVDQDLASTHAPTEALDLAAAVIHARKRRLGPYAAGETPRALANLARAGFSHAVAAKVLGMSLEDAEEVRLGEIERSPPDPPASL